MANLSMAPIMPVVLGMLQRQAVTRDLNLRGDIELLEAQGIQQRNQQEKITQQVFSQFLTGGTSAMDKSMLPDDSDTPITSANKAMRIAQREAQQSEQMAQKILAAGGSLDVAERYITDSRLARSRVLAASKEVAKETKDQNQRVGDIAGFGSAEDNFQSAIEQLRREDPALTNKLTFDRDPTGNPVWGPKSQLTMQALAHSSMSVRDQMLAQEKAQDDLRKDMDQQRKDRAEKEKVRVDDSTIAKNQAGIQASQALAEERRENMLLKQAASQRLGSTASKPATAAMKNMSESSIKASFDGPFDGTLGAFSGDVADRANKIRADAARVGEDLSLDEARQQAIAELKPFVKKHMVGETKIGPITFGGQEKYTYSRSSTKPSVGENASKSEPEIAKAEIDRTTLKSGLELQGRGTQERPFMNVSTKAIRDQLPSGSYYIGPDGKPWIKQ